MPTTPLNVPPKKSAICTLCKYVVSNKVASREGEKRGGVSKQGQQCGLYAILVYGASNRRANVYTSYYSAGRLDDNLTSKVNK